MGTTYATITNSLARRTYAIRLKFPIMTRLKNRFPLYTLLLELPFFKVVPGILEFTNLKTKGE